jgi:hypothetical protein
VAGEIWCGRIGALEEVCEFFEYFGAFFSIWGGLGRICN